MTESGRGAAADRAVPAVSPELPPQRWRLLLSILQRLPQAALSRTFGQLADVRVPATLRPMVLGGFARMLGIDLTEAEKPLENYDSLNDLFVRRLRPDARTWPDEAAAIAAPVDGVLGRSGSISGGRLIQAKGRTYSVADLLGSEAEARRYEGGAFITLYLSPRHYHRIHAPVRGVIVEARHMPGSLLPVNAAAVMHLENLFPRNERVSCAIDADVGRVTVVAVGAYNVGRISTAFDTAWLAADRRGVRNRRGPEAEHRVYDPGRPVACGDEIMAFHLGSTVIVLLEPGARLEALEAGSEVVLGGVLARSRSVQ